MGAGDGTYVYTSSSSEPTFMGKSAMFDEDVRSVQAPLMKLNFVLLTVVNIALLVTIMWYSFRKPKTKLKHSVYDNSRVRTGVIAVSCAHVGEFCAVSPFLKKKKFMLFSWLPLPHNTHTHTHTK
ncbi:MAG: hypothetical protein BJ554DRAFT_1955 [Olpidium bornovanus]|uniref:Uncharacterized protein n=1 Tax=Olpidium bornovanus TaxID=278681 RepID=A0A8H7ZR83_9FUNG|nr:MAG: hypothetical protein BJ554DRAFT_1955 [Olpidium bornovanus]